MLRRFGAVLSAAAVAGAALLVSRSVLRMRIPAAPTSIGSAPPAPVSVTIDRVRRNGPGDLFLVSGLASKLRRDGRTITGEAVDYPAKAVPADGACWVGSVS